jgi:hypothetical protein
MNTKEFNFKGAKMSGFWAAFIYLLLMAASIIALPLFPVSAVISVTVLIVWPFGFMINEPNNARVMIFFGKYKGTFKDNGFFWVNPLYKKKKITLRARNLDAAPIKVNDKTGNPVMIGMVLVWKVVDTYKSVFEIDTSSLRVTATMPAQIGELMKSFENFVKIQSDAALREVAGRYAYDDNELAHEEITLRSGGDQVNTHLEKELNERLKMAGIEVFEARINYLAYAPEIAAIMLRRQQASAIISARSKIVEGAVSMVQMALELLDKENVVEMDEDKKAAMVSNLLVVLCADEAAQPVVNTGTLHQ